ncbi:hypothetical protein PInf_011993 [Phytophthora infestans]|nr:hypothetical protein PInf_011993 [Phytophthora infestans]
MFASNQARLRQYRHARDDEETNNEATQFALYDSLAKEATEAAQAQRLANMARHIWKRLAAADPSVAKAAAESSATLGTAKQLEGVMGEVPEYAEPSSDVPMSSEVNVTSTGNTLVAPIETSRERRFSGETVTDEPLQMQTFSAGDDDIVPTPPPSPTFESPPPSPPSTPAPEPTYTTVRTVTPPVYVPPPVVPREPLSRPTQRNLTLDETLALVRGERERDQRERRTRTIIQPTRGVEEEIDTAVTEQMEHERSQGQERRAQLSQLYKSPDMLTPEAVDLRREVARQHRELAEAEESDSDSDVVEVPRPPSPPREVIEISDDELESPRNRRQAPSQREWQRDIESLRGQIEQSQRRGRTDEVLRRRLEQILPSEAEPELSDTGYTSEEDRGRSRSESEDESEETSLRSKNRSHDVSTDAASAEFHISRILNRINKLGDDHTIVIRPVVNTSNLWDECEPLNDIRIVFSDGKFKFVSEETGHNRPSIARRINWRLTLQNLEETERDNLDVGEYLRFRDERRFPKQREVETSDDVHSDSLKAVQADTEGADFRGMVKDAILELGGERYVPVFKASDDNHTWYFDETGALRSRNSGKITHLKSANTIYWEATLQDLVARLGPNRLPNSFTVKTRRKMTYQYLAIDLNESQAHKACKGRGIRLTPGQFGKGRTLACLPQLRIKEQKLSVRTLVNRKSLMLSDRDSKE